MLEGEGLMGAREDHEELDAIFARWHGKKMTDQQFRQQLTEWSRRLWDNPSDRGGTVTLEDVLAEYEGRPRPKRATK